MIICMAKPDRAREPQFVDDHERTPLEIYSPLILVPTCLEDRKEDMDGGWMGYLSGGFAVV